MSEIHAAMKRIAEEIKQQYDEEAEDKRKEERMLTVGGYSIVGSASRNYAAIETVRIHVDQVRARMDSTTETDISACASIVRNAVNNAKILMVERPDSRHYVVQYQPPLGTGSAGVPAVTSDTQAARASGDVSFDGSKELLDKPTAGIKRIELAQSRVDEYILSTPKDPEALRFLTRREAIIKLCQFHDPLFEDIDRIVVEPNRFVVDYRFKMKAGKKPKKIEQLLIEKLPPVDTRGENPFVVQRDELLADEIYDAEKSKPDKDL